MKRYIVIFLILCLTATGVSFGSFFSGKSDKKSNAPASGASASSLKAPAGKPAAGAPVAPLITVSAAKAIDRQPVLIKKYVGTFEPIEKYVCLARISGNIEQQPFKEGDLVAKDSVLFEIEKIRYLATLDAAKARITSGYAKIDSIKAKLKQSESRLRYAQNNYDRNRTLFEQGSVVSKDAMENAKSVLDGQTAEHQSIQAEQLMAEADVQAALADIKITEDDLSHCTIHSTITGRAGRVDHTLGNYITPATGPLVTIVQMDPIYFRFSMSEKDFVSMFGNIDKLKSTATIKIQMANGQFYNQKCDISFVDNQLKATTNTINVWATCQNSEEVLRPGGVATVWLSKPEPGVKPTIQTSALMFDGVTHYIYVLDSHNVVEKRKVVLGPTDGDWQTIESGLKTGEVVVIDGTHKIMLRPGPDGKIMPVEVNPVFESDSAPAQPSTQGGTSK